MKNNSTNPAQRKTTLKWDVNGELSSIDMTRIINDLSIKELKECELTCNIVQINKNYFLKSFRKRSYLTYTK